MSIWSAVLEKDGQYHTFLGRVFDALEEQLSRLHQYLDLPLIAVPEEGDFTGRVPAWAAAGAVNGAFWAAYWLNLWTFVVGEAVACYVLGTVLLRLLPRIRFFYHLILESRLHAA